MQKFDHNYVILTLAASRNAESDHKSCEKSQLLRHPRFPRCAYQDPLAEFDLSWSAAPPMIDRILLTAR